MMATNSNLNLCLLLLLLHLVVSSPIQKVLTNHCEGQDCEIDVQYHDGNRDISLQTRTNDSVISALLDISIIHEDTLNQDNLTNLLTQIVQMFSSMVKDQHDSHQHLDNMVQQLIIETTSPTPELLNYVTTSPEQEIEVTHGPDQGQGPDQGHFQNCSFAPSSGQYSIFPPDIHPLVVVCDMDTTTGGWIVIQRRFDGSLVFDRKWADYEYGFGSLDGEFWFGLSNMHQLTSHGTCKVRFDLEDFDGQHAYAEYDSFRVGDSNSEYQLTIGSFSDGDAGDSMIGNHDRRFTTKDNDNDNYHSNCADLRRGGWWHDRCGNANINGLYFDESVIDTQAMTWFNWKSKWEALKKTEMKVKCVY